MNTVKKSAKNGSWRCNLRGDMFYSTYYDIMHFRLDEVGLISQLLDKRWFDIDEFLPVYNQARENAGLNPIIIW